MDATQLTPKQAAFVREYLADLDISQAAIRSEYELCSKPAGYYVYLLCDSRSGRIFYVGKGKGRRRYDHVSEAKNLRFSEGNARKHREILEILDAAGVVECPVFQDGLTESDAFALERALIRAIGKKNLTNHSSGVVTSRERFRLLLDRMRSLDAWMRIPVEPHGLWNDDAGRVAFYRKFEANLRRGVEA